MAESVAGAVGPGGLTGDYRVGTVLVDHNDHLLHADRIAEELTGYRCVELLGRDVHALTQPGESLVDVSGDGTGYPVRLRRADGATRVVTARCLAVPLPHGSPAWLVHLVDVAGARRRHSHLGLLDAMFHQSPVGMLILDERLRYVMVNEALARMNDRPAGDHIGRHLREVVASPDIDAYENMLRGVLDTGEPVIDVSIPRTSTAKLDSRKVASASWYRMVNRFGVPLGLCGYVYDVTDSRYKLLVDARGRERAQLLGAVSAVAGSSLDMETLAAELAELLTAGFCDLTVIDVLREIVSGQPADADDLGNAGPYRLAGACRLADPRAQRIVAERGPRPLTHTPVLKSILDDQRARLLPGFDEMTANAPEGLRAALAELGATSALVAPLRARGATFGSLGCMRMGDQAAFDDNDLDLAREIAGRVALTLDNARLYREEKRTALVLQLGLLPERLPAVAQAAMECRYVPGHTGRHAGGDWYDAIALPGHGLAMVIGDVAGHGLAAAAAMGRYRSVVHALASVGLAPGALLTRLNEIAVTFDEHALATCLYVYYDPGEHRCGIASAGHPPLIVAPPGEAARPLGVPVGPMLGAADAAEYRTESIAAPPGTRLLLYSDGLIESRLAPIEAGIDALARRIGSAASPLSRQADEVMATAPPDNHDDRTLLLAQLRGLPRGDVDGGRR